MLNDTISGFIDSIYGALHQMIMEFLKVCFYGLFYSANDAIKSISSELQKTPQSYNSAIFDAVQKVAENTILPIGIMIVTALFCYDLINGVLEKNAMHEMGSEFFFKWLGRACIGVLLLSYTFPMCNAIFDLGKEVTVKATTSFTGGEENLIDEDIFYNKWLIKIEGFTDGEIKNEMFFSEAKKDGNPQACEWNTSVGKGLLMILESIICRIGLIAFEIMIKVIIAVRMLEIYMYLSISPIPFATFINRDWSNVGTNYIKNLLALAFQAFFMLICIGIYYVLVKEVNKALTSADLDLSTVTFALLTTTATLWLGIKSSKSISQSIFGGH